METQNAQNATATATDTRARYAVAPNTAGAGFLGGPVRRDTVPDWAQIDPMSGSVSGAPLRVTHRNHPEWGLLRLERARSKGGALVFRVRLTASARERIARDFARLGARVAVASTLDGVPAVDLEPASHAWAAGSRTVKNADGESFKRDANAGAPSTRTKPGDRLSVRDGRTVWLTPAGVAAGLTLPDGTTGAWEAPTERDAIALDAQLNE